MKKVFISSALIIGVASLYQFVNKTDATEGDMQLSDIEALSDCGVRNSDGTLIKKCVGDEPVFHKMQIGSATVSCFGKQVYTELKEV